MKFVAGLLRHQVRRHHGKQPPHGRSRSGGVQTGERVPRNERNAVVCGPGRKITRQTERRDRRKCQAARGERPIHRSHEISPGQEGETRGQKGVGSGEQSPTPGGNKLFTQTQGRRNITWVPAQQGGTGIERRIRGKERTEPRNHRIRLRHQGPITAVFAGLGRGGKVRRVNAYPGAVSAAVAGHELSALVGCRRAPLGTRGSEQIRRSAKARDPAVSQEVAAAAKIDDRTGGGAHFVTRQGDPARRQAVKGDINATRIDPRKPVRAQTEGNGQADRRDGRRAAARQGDRAGHRASTAADRILRTVEGGRGRVEVRAVPAENNRTERGAQCAVLADVGSKDAQRTASRKGCRPASRAIDHDRARATGRVISENVECGQSGGVNLRRPEGQITGHVQRPITSDVAGVRREQGTPDALQGDGARVDQPRRDIQRPRSAQRRQRIVDDAAAGQFLPERLEALPGREGRVEFAAEDDMAGVYDNLTIAFDDAAASHADGARCRDARIAAEADIAAERKISAPEVVAQVERTESAGGELGERKITDAGIGGTGIKQSGEFGTVAEETRGIGHVAVNGGVAEYGSTPLLIDDEIDVGTFPQTE